MGGRDRRRDDYLPYPEYVDKVVRKRGQTIKIDRAKNREGRYSRIYGRMIVPFGGSVDEDSTRTHELAHALLSPSKPRCTESLEMAFEQVVEDARIQIYTASVGETLVYPESMSDTRATIASGKFDELSMVLLSVSAVGTAHEEELKTPYSEIAKDRIMRSAKRREKKYGKRIASRREVLATARDLAALFRKQRDVLKFVGESAKVHAECLLESARVPGRGGSYVSPHEFGVPGRMMIEECEMTMDMRPPEQAGTAPEREKYSVASVEGSVVRYIHRWSIDQAIFRRTKKRLVPKVIDLAVLIDDSASMRTTLEEIQECVSLTPSSIIGVYSGSGKRGMLSIVARNGKCIADLSQYIRFGSGNIVDLPALQWLAEQPASKKVWISDGMVTGINDHQYQNILEERNNIVDENSIKRIENMESFLSMLEGGEI